MTGPQFERGVKTDLLYTGKINGKTWVVPHSYDDHGATKAMRHSIVVNPVHVAHNNPGFTPEEITQVNQHIKHTHGGQEPSKLKSLTEMTEERQMALHLGMTKSDRAEPAKEVVPKTKRAVSTKSAEENKAEREKYRTAALAKRHAALYASREAATLAFARRKHIIKERTITFGSMKFNKIANTKSVTYNSFGKVVKEESMLQESSWRVTDHLGKTHEVLAKDASEAKRKAVSVGGVHPQGIPMTQWGKVKVVPMKEAVEQIDEISALTAKHVGDKRHSQGLKFYGMADRSTDPLVKKVFLGKAEKLNKKAHAAYGYSYKKSHADLKKLEESMELEESFMRTYNSNENANRHTENVVHLAKHFGTKADQSQAKFFADELKKHGHNIHHEAANKLHEKLWPSAVAAHNHVKEEVEQIDELKKSTLKNYIKGASQSLVTHAHISARAREHERTERNAGHPIAQDHFRKGAETYEKKTSKRLVGVQRAAKKLEENMSPDKKKADAKAHKELWNTPAMSDADFNKRYPLPSEKKKARMNWHKHGGKLFREEEHSDTFNTVKTVIHEALRKNLRSQSDIDKFARRGRAAKNLLGLPQSLKWPKPIAGVPNGGKTGTDTLKEAVSRKDFQMAAALIKANPNATDRQTLANHHAHVFAQSNPRFDHAKFHAAAGTQYSHISNQDN